MENRNNNPIAEEIIHNNPTGYGLFAGIGDNFNSAAQAICELADDAISNLRANSDDPDLSMTIVVSFENLGDAVEISVVDGGTGITNLDSALTIACRDGAQTPLNEHGFGLKHALASCDSSPSQQWSIRTRTKGDAAADQYREVTAPYSMGTSEEDQPMKVFFYPGAGGLPYPTGTAVTVRCPMAKFQTVKPDRKAAQSDFHHLVMYAIEELRYTSKMYLSASLSYKATSDPSLDGKKVMDFSDWKTFTVTSGDKTVQNTYRIKVVSKAQAEITSFRVQAVGEWYNGVIDNAKSTITVTDVDDSKLTSTKLVTDIEFTGRSCSPTSGIAVDFANAATFTLGGDNDLASRTYTVIVLNKSGQPISAKSGGGDDDTPSTSTAKITGFSVLGVDGVIDQSAGIITVTLPAGTNVTAVAPVVTVPAGAVVSPVSGEVVNLTSPLTYAVTLGAESTSYTVTVIFERSISQQLWGAVAENSDVADHQTSYGHKFN